MPSSTAVSSAEWIDNVQCSPTNRLLTLNRPPRYSTSNVKRLGHGEDAACRPRSAPSAPPRVTTLHRQPSAMAATSGSSAFSTASPSAGCGPAWLSRQRLPPTSRQRLCDGLSDRGHHADCRLEQGRRFGRRNLAHGRYLPERNIDGAEVWPGRGLGLSTSTCSGIFRCRSAPRSIASIQEARSSLTCRGFRSLQRTLFR